MKTRRTNRSISTKNGMHHNTSGFLPASPDSSFRSNRVSSPSTIRYSRNSGNYTAKKRRGAKVAVCVMAAVLVVIVGAGMAFASYVSSIDRNLQGGKSSEEQQAIKEQLMPRKSFDEPFYMMLIGSDARSDGSVEGERSDTNILCRVDPSRNQVTMISVPRDTMIDIDGYGTNKFNAAYSFGGAAAVIRETSELCGVEISHYAEVNFESLVSLVDVVGGVTVDVPERIDDPDAGQYVIEEGEQTLDGERALVFARSRAYADGDFTRTSNQRLLIEALVKKVLSMPASDLPGVIEEASKCVSTDMSTFDIVSLATQFQDAGDLTVYSAMVPSTTADIDGVSYVICDEASLAEMMRVVEEGEDPNSIQTAGSVIGSSLYDNPYGTGQAYEQTGDESEESSL